MKRTKSRKCIKPIYRSLSHKGNTWTNVKYAIQCTSIINLQKTKHIFQKIGFKVVKEENDKFHHTFLYPPRSIHFMIILSLGKATMIKGDFRKHSRVGTHLGFKVTRKKRVEMEKILCSEKTMIVKKPDETSLFLQLPCGEIIEFSG